MRKSVLMIAALALVLGISQCKKQEKPVSGGEKQYVVLNASFADNGAKIAEDGQGTLKWNDEVGSEDIIKVYNESDQTVSIGDLKCTNAENGIFEGPIEGASGNLVFKFGAQQQYDAQSGNLQDAIYLTAPTPYVADGNYDVKMNMPHAVLKLDVSALGTSGALTVSDGTTTATVTSVEDPTAVFVAVPADGSEKEYTISFGGKTATEKWPPLKPNYFYTSSSSTTGEAIVIVPDVPVVPEGTLSGQFSIDNAGHVVYFTKGHLQFQPSTQHWRFATNQYDRLHAVTVEDASNEYKSDYTGWIELFGWGTSNHEYGATCWRPWETDATDTNYGNGEINLSGESDWGCNDIYYDDTHTVTGFRTLTVDEFNHIIERVDGRGKHLCGFAKVHGVPGVILLPDNWERDFFANWNTEHHASFKWIAWTNPTQQNGWVNVIDNDLWDAMEEAGAVFLPFLGSRNGNEITCIETSPARYWLSSFGSKPTYAVNCNFYIGTYKDNFFSTGSTYRHIGGAVRLVYNAN